MLMLTPDSAPIFLPAIKKTQQTILENVRYENFYFYFLFLFFIFIFILNKHTNLPIIYTHIFKPNKLIFLSQINPYF